MNKSTKSSVQPPKSCVQPTKSSVQSAPPSVQPTKSSVQPTNQSVQPPSVYPIKPQLDPRTRRLVSALQSQFLHRGIGALKQLSCVFRQMDIDYSKKICFQELALGVKHFHLNFSPKDLRDVFSALDRDGNGQIDFKEFMDLLTPPMTEVRIRVINEVFDKLDVNGDGAIQLEDLKIVYAANARQHPNYLSGLWTEEETLKRFLDGLDTPGCPDGQVTRQEFMNYYAEVSATVDDDCYFDMTLRALYSLPPFQTKR